MTSAFITGITGQDGGYLTERLLAEGVEVHGLALAGDPATEGLRAAGATVHDGDLGDPAQLARLVDEIQPDEIYSLGGVSSVALSWERPLLTAQITGQAVAALLEAAWSLQQRRSRPVRLVQASSAEIFGDAEVVPQDERTPIRPTSPYGAAKAYAHQLVGVYRARGLHACACILYNHESPRRPPAFVTRKITMTVARIAAGLEHELVLGNLDARRDWGWAPDYVDALVRAVRHEHADDYVIASGVAHSVADFVAAAFAACQISDWRQLVRTDPAFVRPVDPHLQVGDASKAGAELGWQPTVGFEQLVARMIESDLAALDGRSAARSREHR